MADESELWWKGEKSNNGPGWMGPRACTDDDQAWYFSTREVYLIKDPALPRSERFESLRIELTISRGEEQVAVLNLTADDWYNLADLMFRGGRWAARLGL
jgi:hypothetical protein